MMNWYDLRKWAKIIDFSSVKTSTERWEQGEQSSEAQWVALALAAADVANNRQFDFDFGGDGDNGEELIYLIDQLIELGIVTVTLPATDEA